MDEIGQENAWAQDRENVVKDEYNFGRGRIESFSCKSQTPQGNGDTATPVVFAQGYFGDKTLPW